jgi:hypothetical protein
MTYFQPIRSCLYKVSTVSVSTINYPHRVLLLCMHYVQNSDCLDTVTVSATVLGETVECEATNVTVTWGQRPVP